MVCFFHNFDVRFAYSGILNLLQKGNHIDSAKKTNKTTRAPKNLRTLSSQEGSKQRKTSISSVWRITASTKEKRHGDGNRSQHYRSPTILRSGVNSLHQHQNPSYVLPQAWEWLWQRADFQYIPKNVNTQSETAPLLQWILSNQSMEISVDQKMWLDARHHKNWNSHFLQIFGIFSPFHPQLIQVCHIFLDLERRVLVPLRWFHLHYLRGVHKSKAENYLKGVQTRIMNSHSIGILQRCRLSYFLFVKRKKTIGFDI